MSDPHDPEHDGAPEHPPTWVAWWDGTCGFCKRFVDAAQARTKARVRFTEYQHATAATCPVPQAELAQAMHATHPDGTVLRGGAAALAVLAQAPRLAWPYWVYRHVPGVAPLVEAVYRWVAGHRPLMSRLARFDDRCRAAGDAHTATVHLLMRGLGLVYLIAFASLAWQRPGLFGPDGIVPLAPRMNVLAEAWNGAHWGRLPTLLWWSAGEAMQRGLIAVGMLAALWLIAGDRLTRAWWGRRTALAAAWLAYVSFATAGEPFMSFQWDSLLLEAGALALLAVRRDGGRPTASIAGVWLLRWLFFRLMLSSGLVKIGSRDGTWMLLSALDFHYWTQPLPNTLSYWAHHLPDWTRRAGTAATLVLELGLPWLVWLGRHARIACFAGTALLMTAIALTGNYGFFNLLTVVLALALLDDRRLAGWTRRRPWPPSSAAPQPLASPRPRLVPLPGPLRPTLAVLLLLASLAPLAGAAGIQAPGPAHAAYRLLQPLRVVAGYGLFARMTTSRPELSFEVLNGAGEWRRVDLRFKPGPLDRRPPQVAPHMPRLDWQLWFAALGDLRRNRWVVDVAKHLCRQTPAVLDLFGTPDADALRPPAAPPEAIRVVRESYQFARPRDHRNHGHYWRKNRGNMYMPQVPCSVLR